MAFINFLVRLISNWPPNPEIIIQVTNRIVKAFQNTIQVELIKVRWEDIK